MKETLIITIDIALLRAESVIDEIIGLTPELLYKINKMIQSRKSDESWKIILRKFWKFVVLDK